MIQLLLGAFIFISAPVFMKNRIKAFSIPLMALYVLEAMLLVSIWTVVSLPFVYMDQKFSTAVYVYNAILIGIYAISFLYGYTKKKYRCFVWKELLNNIGGFVKENKELCICTIALIGYQLLRCTILQTNSYRDSKTYIAFINDMVETNRFFLLDEVSAYFRVDLETVSPKYIFSGWYSFEAYISYISGLHPLIIVNTVLPPIIMLFSYMSYWLMSELFFKDDYRRRVLFVLIIALIFQFLNDDTSVIFMVWPTWGKNLILSISIPIYLYFCFREYKVKNYQNLLLFLVVFFACFVSTMGVVLMSVIIVGCKAYRVLIKRQLLLCDGVNLLAQFTPMIIYTLIYKMW